jgi:hypothetical protein
MDKDILQRAVELGGRGLRMRQIARQLGVNHNTLREELSKFNSFEEAVVIVPDSKPLATAAYDVVFAALRALDKKINDPFAKVSELSSAIDVCYKIYRAENSANGEDDNTPVMKLFGDDIKLLKGK